MIKFIIFALAAFAPMNVAVSFELKGLQFLIQILTGELSEKGKSKEEVAIVPAEAHSNYTFLDFISYREREQCFFFGDEPYMKLHNKEGKAGIRVKCATDHNNRTEKIQIMDNVKETISLLSPYGNSTKRSEPGNCVLLLFYTKSCPGSSMVAPHYNALQRQFPYLRILAIDAFKHRSLNTEFGIVGLPTIMLFHQGRPVVKFNDTLYNLNNFVKFITKHTGLTSKNFYVTSEDFLGPLSNKIERDIDYWLILAWIFIIVCSCYYFSKSSLYSSIIEMAKRNWRESEAQHEHNN